MPWLEQTMRWYGPNDAVSLRDIRQSGCSGVVTALHQIPVGEVWTREEVIRRRELIEAENLTWTVVESLPVHEDIKKGKATREQLIANYKQSIRNLAAEGIKVITYNFMPVLDWLRTDLNYPMPDTTTALRFERAAFVAFDLFMLGRPGAKYDPSEEQAARQWYSNASDADKTRVYQSCLQGLPGSKVAFTPEQVLTELTKYGEISPDQLRQNLLFFLHEVCPVAEEEGVKMAIHPDDPPYPVLGLPRIMSTEADVECLLEGCESPANGLCFCTGSYGARADNNIPQMLARFGSSVHFLHLRNTKRDENGDFFETDHLGGDTDMFAVINLLVELMHRENRAIPMRPDHGHTMMEDAQKDIYPGYGVLGRMKGLAELRGLELAVQRHRA